MLRTNGPGAGRCAALRVGMAYGRWDVRVSAEAVRKPDGLGIVDAPPFPPRPGSMTSFTASYGFPVDDVFLKALTSGDPRRAQAIS